MQERLIPWLFAPVLLPVAALVIITLTVFVYQVRLMLLLGKERSKLLLFSDDGFGVARYAFALVLTAFNKEAFDENMDRLLTAKDLQFRRYPGCEAIVARLRTLYRIYAFLFLALAVCIIIAVGALTLVANKH